MKERPIIFTGESVRAILAGRKTQTRRVAPFHVDATTVSVAIESGKWCAWIEQGGASSPVDVDVRCPYGVPGGRLWVKETWCRAYDLDSEQPVEPPEYLYRATEDRNIVHYEGGYNADGTKRSPWLSPLMMWRHASRLTLDVTGVRVERVQEISEGDAIAEGVDDSPGVRLAFAKGWDRINGKRPGCAWSDNPWVWVIEFKVAPPGAGRE